MAFIPSREYASKEKMEISMKIKVLYSKSELDATVKFISTYNQFFIGKDSEIRDSILRTVDGVIEQFPSPPFTGTMGFMIEGDVLEIESVDADDNVLWINFYVNPRLMTDQPLTDEELNLDTVQETREI